MTDTQELIGKIVGKEELLTKNKATYYKYKVEIEEGTNITMNDFGNYLKKTPPLNLNMGKNYTITYEESEYENKTGDIVVSKNISAAKELADGIAKIKDEFKKNNESDFVQAKDYKRDSVDKIIRMHSQKVAIDVIKLRYQNNLVDKHDITEEMIEEAHRLEDDINR